MHGGMQRGWVRRVRTEGLATNAPTVRRSRVVGVAWKPFGVGREGQMERVSN